MKASVLGLLLASLCFSPALIAQNSLKGKILTEKGEALLGVTIQLFRGTDRTFIKGMATDTAGQFFLENLPNGTYHLDISMVSYQSQQVAAIALNNAHKDLANIILKEDIQQIARVEVIGKKDLIEIIGGTLSMNLVDNPIAAGGTALDALMRFPGVLVDQQNNSISIAGKAGVQLMINGKVKNMPLSAITQMLASMNADNIVKIEVITTPPASLDAEGNAGFINIVLKSRPDDGLNGSYTLSGGWGRGPVASFASDFNLRQGKLNLFGDYSWNLNARDQHFSFYRSNPHQGQIATTDTYIRRDPVNNNQVARLGADYQVSKKTLVGLLFSGFNNDQVQNSINTSQRSTNGYMDTLVRIQMYEKHVLSHWAGNFNIQHEWDKNATLSLDLDYLHYLDRNPSEYINDYSNGQGKFLYTSEIKSRKYTPINMLVGKMDFIRKWSPKIRMEAGIKAVRSTFVNDVGVDVLKDELWTAEPDLTAKFRLLESIAAAYNSWDIQASKKTNLKLGLRYEFTDSNLGSEERSNIVDRRYGNFFPSFSISQKLDDRNTLNLAYSRRITRPTFNEMAPFVAFIDPNSFFSGNAALQPALGNNLSFSYRHQGMFLLVQYTHEDSAMARFQTRIDTERNRNVIASENMRSQKIANISLNFPVTISKAWNMQFNVYGNWQQSNLWYNAQLLQVAQTYFGFNINQRIKISPKLSTEFNGWYRSKSLLFGTYTMRANFGTSAGVQYQLGKKGDLLNFNVADIFNSVAWVLSSNLESQNIVSSARVDFSQTTFRLSYRHNFGNSNSKAIRQRKEAEEKARVQPQ